MSQLPNFKKIDYWRYSNFDFLEDGWITIFPIDRKVQGMELENFLSKLEPSYREEKTFKNLKNILDQFSNHPILLFHNSEIVNLKETIHNLSIHHIELEVEENDPDLSVDVLFGLLPNTDGLNLQQRHRLNYADLFCKLNEKTKTGSVRLRVAKHQEVEKPLVIIHLRCDQLIDSSLNEKHSRVTSPYLKLEVEENASLKMIECFLSIEVSEESRSWSNVKLEVSLQKGATLTQLSLQQEGTEGHHLSSTEVTQMAKSHYRSLLWQQGGLTSSVVRKVDFHEEEAEASLFGLYQTGQSQNCDNIIDINHRVPNCESHQLYKGVLKNNGVAGFTGKVTVFKDAQQTFSDQLNNTLILGEDGLMQSRPQLEILADDVKCNHGSTVGRVNQEELFYLMSRGLPFEVSQNILADSFLKEFYQEMENRVPEAKSLVELFSKK